MGYQVRQIGVPDTKALVGIQLAHHGLLRFKVGHVGVRALHHMLHGGAAQEVVHVHILVVASGHRTVETVTISHHCHRPKLAGAHQSSSGRETGRSHCKE